MTSKGSVLIEILRYIYTRDVENIQEHAAELLYGAEKYQLKYIKATCVKALIDNLSIENAVDCFMLADLYGEQEFLEICVRFIKA